MAAVQDIWYVKLPSGRVVRSRTTAVLQHHLRKGRIPRNSRVRRSGGTWQPLDDVRELADVIAPKPAESNGAPQPTMAPRPRAVEAPTRAPTNFSAWRKLGTRGLFRELLDALDSSLHRAKLGLACGLGVLACVGWIAWCLIDAAFAEAPLWWTATAILTVVVVLLGCLAMSLISQITFIELSHRRQPRREELWPLVLGITARLALSLVVGAGAGIVVGLRSLPGWMLAQAGEGESFWTYGAAAALIVHLVLEVVFWPVLAFAPLLLGPILVVEQCSAPRALLEWWRLLKKHLGRIFLYEALASALGGIFTAPLVAPILLVAATLGGLEGLQLHVGQATLLVLGGIALTPLLAYLLAANVFIYLNLRYEFFHSAANDTAVTR